MYDIIPMNAPRTTGWRLSALAGLLEHPLAGPPLAEYLFGLVGMQRLRSCAPPDALPSIHPLLAGFPLAEPSPLAAPPAVAAEHAPEGFPFKTVADFARAYREGLSPVEVAEKVLARRKALDQAQKPLGAFIAQDEADVRAQARASAERFAAGKPLGPLDGVPIAIKDELDQLGYATTVGTRFLGAAPAAKDAEVVRRLRAAGAVLIGKTNMHEIGMGATGHNVHHGAARNPYDLDRAAGGSSGGSAAAVAAGLCPAAVGADGGGSIRIPASLCGLVGLKPTFGRVSEQGAAPICWSLAHVGPLAASAEDAALLYMLMAGKDAGDPTTWHQPAPTQAADLRGLKLGVFRPWFEDADDAVVTACSGMLAELGAQVVEIQLPELGLAATAHMVTIAAEMAASQAPHFPSRRRDYSPEVQFNLALARRLRAADYAQAQRIRVAQYRAFMDAFRLVDAIVTPGVACVAPLLSREALTSGESDLVLLDRLMRYARPANLTGLPAIAFPAGYDVDGLPIGMQVMGRPWDEGRLLGIARAAERAVPRKAPGVYTSLL
ncbi:MAG: gatA [Cyanobacteria bacterium RYN_339]|nr:gatA [Cyanobacteria bacterium RYN_339]